MTQIGSKHSNYWMTGCTMAHLSSSTVIILHVYMYVPRIFLTRANSSARSYKKWGSYHWRLPENAKWKAAFSQRISSRQRKVKQKRSTDETHRGICKRKYADDAAFYTVAKPWKRRIRTNYAPRAIPGIRSVSDTKANFQRITLENELTNTRDDILRVGFEY